MTTNVSDRPVATSGDLARFRFRIALTGGERAPFHALAEAYAARGHDQGLATNGRADETELLYGIGRTAARPNAPALQRRIDRGARRLAMMGWRLDRPEAAPAQPCQSPVCPLPGWHLLGEHEVADDLSCTECGGPGGDDYAGLCSSCHARAERRADDAYDERASEVAS